MLPTDHFVSRFFFDQSIIVFNFIKKNEFARINRRVMKARKVSFLKAKHVKLENVAGTV
jgi:hypothetical protein